MRIIIGSLAPPKISGAKAAIRNYPRIAHADVTGTPVTSIVTPHPLSLEELIHGAEYRALKAFENCRYGIGIEDGSLPTPGTETGMMIISVCAIYDGSHYSHGMSCGYELPTTIAKLVQDGVELSDACITAGLCTPTEEKLGYLQGAIGILTNGRINRTEQIKQGVMMALIPLTNTELYQHYKR